MNYFTITTFTIVMCVGVRSTTVNQCEIAQVCVTDFSQADCFSTQVLVQNSHIYNCCPSCQTPVGSESTTGKWYLYNFILRQ